MYTPMIISSDFVSAFFFPPFHTNGFGKLVLGTSEK
jgi:hypothetical protein